MRLPTMTTRRWMIVVVIVGLLMGGARLKQTRDHFLSRAQYHESRERRFRAIGRSLSDYPANTKFFMPTDDFSSKGAIPGIAHLTRGEMGLPEKIAYHAAMARKYWRVARRPWIPVEPDPPDSK
jgi:hypothetical protein